VQTEKAAHGDVLVQFLPVDAVAIADVDPVPEWLR
jgi:hypothetical protein